MKESNIIIYLRLREIGYVFPYFRNKYIVLSRPNFEDDYFNADYMT